MPALPPVALIGRRKSIFDEIDDVEEPKPIEQLIDETPTSGLAGDLAKRTGRSMVKMPGQVVTGGGGLLDVMERALRAYGASQANTSQAFLPEHLREKPELPAEAMARELRRPSAGGRLVQKIGRQMTAQPEVAGIGSVDYTGDLAPDPLRDREILPMAADSAGSLAAAMGTPGGVVAKTITGALLQSGGQAEQAREFLLRKGEGEDAADAEAAKQFVLNIPAGAIESVAWGRYIGKFGGANLLNAVKEKYGKTVAKRLLRTTLEQAGIEGGEEMAQQLWGNLTARNYNPEQKLGEGVIESGAVGAIMGGGLAGSTQAAAEAAAQLDTGKNQPERKTDLQAQQRQLVDGNRTVQMFPLGTEELALPKGMERVETPRGVFHFDPRRMTADEILSKSQAGRENELLGLGPHSKGDVERRVKAGEPAATLVERGPNGEELRGAVVTPSTVEATRAALEAGKSEGSTVDLEQMEQTLKQRGADNDIDAMIERAAAEREQAVAASQAETQDREQRQKQRAEKRGKFDFHLGNASAVLLRSGKPGTGSTPTFAEVQGVQRVLEDYAQDNALGLSLEQKQEAQRMIKALEPGLTAAKAQHSAESDARIAAERRQRDEKEAQLREKTKAERGQIQRIERTGRDEEGRLVDLKGVPDEELERLNPDEEGIGQAEIEAERERRLRAEMESQLKQEQGKGASDDLLSVLKKVKLPSEDATLRGELEMLKTEGVNFGVRQQLFSGKAGSLDSVAEVLREDYGFDDIKTPADVIDYAERALRGEKIMPTWRRGGGGEDVSFAREEQPRVLFGETNPDGTVNPDTAIDSRKPTDPLTHEAAGIRARDSRLWRFVPHSGAAYWYTPPSEAQEKALVDYLEDYHGLQVKKTKVLTPGSITPDDLAASHGTRFAREDQTQSAEFRRWFGDSKVVAAVDEATVRDFEARFERIAPGLAINYKVLMGDPSLLTGLGVRPSQLTGTERAAYLHRRKIFWFLQQEIRAGKDGLMPERLRRDVLHETTHAWLDTVDDDTQAELREAWQADLQAKDGWLADVRRRGVVLRQGVRTDWKEYWSERIAEENDRWAERREAIVSQDRPLLAQVAYEFRTWLQETMELLRQAFSRTKRYNVDFRKFLDQGARFVAPEPAGAAQPMAAAQESFAREERSSAEIQQAIEENRRELAGLQESNEAGEEVEARGRDLEAKGKELQRELLDAKRREQAEAFVTNASALQQKPITQGPEAGRAGSAPNPGSGREAPPAPAPAKSTTPVLERIGKEKTLPTSGNQDIEKVAERWRHILPGFQGGKEQMTVPVTQAIRAEFDQAERERIQTVEDYFGGGGSWGLYLALTNFREAKKLIVHEYFPARLAKIRFFHEKGNQTRQVLEQIQPTLAEVVAEMKANQTLSESSISRLLQRRKFSNPDQQAVATALSDWAENSFGTARDESGQKSPVAKMDAGMRILAEQAEAAYEGAQEFRSRGGTIEYVSGDSYAAQPHAGDTVMAVVDPPYYKTKGYAGEAAVSAGTYAKTHDLLARLAEARNNIIYTDEGWWLRPAEQGRKDPQGERILAGVVDFFSKFDVVDTRIANRHETLGIHHGNDPIARIPRMAGAFADAAGDSRQAERRVPARRGILDRAKQAILGLAGRAQDEAGTLRDQGDRGDGPAGELSDRKTALLQELADLNGRINALMRKDGSKAAVRSYLGQRNDVRIALDEEFPKWRREQPRLASGETEVVAEQQPSVPAAPTLPAAENPRLKELREALAHWERQARADFPGAEAWVKKHQELLDKEFPNWRKQPVQSRQRVEEPPVLADPSDLERDASEKPGRDYATRDDIYDQVEGHSSQAESWLERNWRTISEKLRNVRGAIPELPAFADNKEQLYAKLRQGYKMLARGTPRVWKESADQVGELVKPLLEAGTLDADRYQRLGELQARRLRLKADNRAVPVALDQEIAARRREVDREPYGLFQNLALYLDLKWRVENLMDQQGNPIKLPAGINAEEINQRLADLKTKLAASPHKALVLAALKQHQAMVKGIADDLKQRDLRMPEELRNPFYFPHVILEKDGRALGSALERVKMDTAEDFRGYVQRPVGSIRPIETDYAKAMYYHLVAVGSHNLRADIVRDYWAKYNEMDQVRARAKELTRKYGRGVNWKEAFHTEWAPAGYKLWAPDDKLPMHPDLQIDRDTLARRLGVLLTDEPLQPQLEKLGLQGVKIQASDIHEALAAGEKEHWVVPEKVAEALDGILRRETRRAESLLAKPFEMFQALWKRNILFAPWNYPRYEFNNTVTDLEKLLSADPKVYSHLSAAAKEVRAFIEEGKGGKDIHEAFKLGVLETITAAELGDLSVLRQFEALQTTKQKLTTQLLKRASTLFMAGPRATTDLSRLREATFRYAKFKADLERMRAGARPVYAGAHWRDIEAIEDTQPGAGDAMHKKAAEISLATFGDYHNISVLGNELRRYLIPFYSWTEINFRYHANLLTNLKDMVAAGELSQAEAMKSGARAAATFSTRAAVAVMLRLALPYVAVALWNGSGWRRELEDSLSDEDKRRFHIIIGRDEKGKTMLIYAQTALADIAKWFSGHEASRLTMDVVKGRTDLGTAVHDWAARFPRDFANNLWQVGPITRAAITAAFKKSTFPDVTDARTIPAQDVSWAVWSQMTDQFSAEMIRRAIDKDYLASKDVKDWAQQMVLQIRKRDPEQWSFYDIKDKAADFKEQMTGVRDDRSRNSPDQQVLRNFRRSIYRGDVENALRFYDRLLELGYTAERFKASIQDQDPLAELSKEQRRGFVAQLSPVGRYQLEQAYLYYGKMTEQRGAEHRLFPSKKLSEAQRQFFMPRHERLRQEMEDNRARKEEERRQKADREMKKSLRPPTRRSVRPNYDPKTRRIIDYELVEEPLK